MPLVQTRGAASAQGFGEFAQAAVAANYIEEVFSCFLYTGNGSTQTITNNIDLSTKGGLLWIKNRASATYPGNYVFDSARGAGSGLITNTTDAADGSYSTGFTTSGFTLAGDNATDESTITYASWTFRKQPKFFDVVTYTGTGSNTTIAHALGAVPGSIIVKRTDTTAAWAVYHRSLANTQYLVLNTTAAVATGATWWNSTTPTSSVFSLGTDASVNASGGTYVAYLFAHDAGGFGLTGTDNVISCGSFNYNTDPQTVTIGYEPQWLMVKRSDGVGDWIMFDNMRGFTANAGGGIGRRLLANTSGAETANDGLYYGGATGFNLNLPAYGTYIYIAIRRGPMKVPTSGTSVFLPSTYTGSNSVNQVVNTGFTVDMTWARARNAAVSMEDYDRLRGNTVRLSTDLTDAEISSTALYFDLSNSVSLRAGYNLNYSTLNFIAYNFQRAPGFFDEVCYTGTGADPQTVSHNLGVAPELMIFKARAVGTGWRVWGGNMAITEYLALNEDSAVSTGQPAFFGGTLPTATSFYVGSGLSVSARTHVAYLFATAAGVSKVFSYTGNGSSQTINCGFTGGARFVLIKRTDSTGDWYVWDTARGIVSGNDPHLSLNTTAAEVTSNDTIDTDSTGFVVNQVSATNVNVSSATYIGLAIA